MSTLQTPGVTLYSFRRCPYAMRARLALRYAGVPMRIVEVSLKAKPAEMLALSAKGTVPVLALEAPDPPVPAPAPCPWPTARASRPAWP